MSGSHRRANTSSAPTSSRKPASKAPSRSQNGAASSKPKRHSEFLCDLKFRNTLPPVPFEPKFLRYPFPKDRWHKYELTTFEQHYQYRVHMQPGIGPDIHLIDPLSAEVRGVQLAEEDRKLMRKDDDRGGLSAAQSLRFNDRAQVAKEGKSWLVKTQYMENDLFRAVHQHVEVNPEERAAQIEARRQELLKTTESTANLIDKSFQIANSTDLPKHPSKPNLVPVKVLNLIPSIALAENEYYQVSISDTHLLPDVEGKRADEDKTKAKLEQTRIAHGFLQQLTNQENTELLSYLLPKPTLKAENMNVNDLELVRDYAFNIRPTEDQTRYLFFSKHIDQPTSDGLVRGVAEFKELEAMSMELKRKAEDNMGRNPDGSAPKKKRKRIVSVAVNRRDFTPDEVDERDHIRRATLEGAGQEPVDEEQTKGGSSSTKPEAPPASPVEKPKPKDTLEENVWGDDSD